MLHRVIVLTPPLASTQPLTHSQDDLPVRVRSDHSVDHLSSNVGTVAVANRSVVLLPTNRRRHGEWL